MIKILLSWLLLGILLITTLLTSRQDLAQPIKAVSILNPGDGSVVTSPIQLSVELQPGSDTFIRIELFNGSNVIIARQLQPILIDPEIPTTLDFSIPFEIPKESSDALLTVAKFDEFNRPQSLRTVFLTLSSTSPEVIQPSSRPGEDWLTIHSPSLGETISGGRFRIAGTVIPQTEDTIFFELITDSGGEIGNAFLTAGDPGKAIDFDLPIAYSYITTPRDVRPVIRQTSDEYQTTLIMDSLLLTLEP
jgi:hypothetical protein